jgi:glycosyltransferase involved in cell wall biosynthesis
MARQPRVSLVAEGAGEPEGPASSTPSTRVAGLAVELARSGLEVTVLARRDDPTAPRVTALAPGVDLHRLDAGPARPLAGDAAFAHMPAFGQQLRRSWLARPPDVVHALSWTTGWAALSAGIGVPVVQTLAGLGGGRRRPRHQAGDAPLPFERRRIEVRLLDAAAHVVVPCEADRGAIEVAAGPGIAERLSVVPAGIDPELFRPDGPAPRTGARHRVLVHGRLVPQAGVDIAIRALVQLPDTELVVAGGPAPEELDDDPEVRRLRGLAQRCDVGDRVVFAGSVPHAEAAALIRSADVVVCAPWHSRMGVSPIEALACGRPVVGSTVGGVPDTLVPGRTGLLVPPRSPGALAEAVERLLANPSLRLRMGEEGVARVRQHHTWAQVARTTRDVYRAVTTAARQAIPA